MTRAEFEQMWIDKKFGDPVEGARHAELLSRYHAIIVQHPISRVQLWRLEKLEAVARKHAAARTQRIRPVWADQEQPLYVRLLASLLKYVHSSRWRRTMTDEESDAVLAAGVKVLGEGSDAPAYASHLDDTPSHLRPTAHAALLATVKMLEVMKSSKPDMFERFMQRTGTITPAKHARSR
jgi:hypothetical protein